MLAHLGWFLFGGLVMTCVTGALAMAALDAQEERLTRRRR